MVREVLTRLQGETKLSSRRKFDVDSSQWDGITNYINKNKNGLRNSNSNSNSIIIRRINSNSNSINSSRRRGNSNSINSSRSRVINVEDLSEDELLIYNRHFKKCNKLKQIRNKYVNFIKRIYQRELNSYSQSQVNYLNRNGYLIEDLNLNIISKNELRPNYNNTILINEESSLEFSLESLTSGDYDEGRSFYLKERNLLKGKSFYLKERNLLKGRSFQKRNLKERSFLKERNLKD